MNSEERGRFRALQAWARSVGVELEEHRSFHLVDRDSGRPKSNAPLLDLNAVEEALGFLTERPRS